MDLKTLLGHQFMDEEFGRVDILIRTYSVERYLEDKNYDFEFYKKMQRVKRQVRLRKRGNNSPLGRYVNKCVRSFKQLIHSFDQNGFDEKYPIKCSRSHATLDGAHRLAMAYFNRCDPVPVKIHRKQGDPKYTMGWFKDTQEFTSDDFSIIQDELEKLLDFLDIY